MAELSRRLLQQTKSGRITWSAVDREGDEFIYSATSSSATVGPDERGDIRLALLNSRGETAASLEKAWSSDSSDQGEIAPAEWNDILDELYYAARDSALDVSETFKDIFSSLEE
jgi:hypothetical protein